MDWIAAQHSHLIYTYACGRLFLPLPALVRGRGRGEEHLYWHCHQSDTHSDSLSPAGEQRSGEGRGGGGRGGEGRRGGVGGEMMLKFISIHKKQHEPVECPTIKWVMCMNVPRIFQC